MKFPAYMRLALTLTFLGFCVPALAATAESLPAEEPPIIEGTVTGSFCGAGVNEFGRSWTCVKVGNREYSMGGVDTGSPEAQAVAAIKEGTPVEVQFKVVMQFVEEADGEVPFVVPVSIRPQAK